MELYIAKPIVYTFNTERSEVSGEREVDTKSFTHNMMIASDLKLTSSLPFGLLSYGVDYISTKRNDDYVSGNMDVVGNSSSKIKERSLCTFVEYNYNGAIGQISGGVRYENINYKYYEDGMYKPDQSKIFHNFFPSLSFSKQYDNFGYKISYSIKTQRPSYSQLSNNISYANRFLRQSGNPLLKHQTDHVLSAELAYKFLQFSLEYKDSRNAIIYWIEQLATDRSVSFIRYKNIGSVKSMTAYLSLAPTIGFWSPQFNCGLTKQYLTLDTSSGKQKLNNPLFTFSLDNGFALPWGITANLNYTFVSKGNDQNMELVKNQNVLDIGFQKSFCKKKLSVEIKGNDLLYKQWDSLKMYSNSTVLQQICRRGSRSAELTIRYELNTAKSKYKGESAGNSEIQRF